MVYIRFNINSETDAAKYVEEISTAVVEDERVSGVVKEERSVAFDFDGNTDDFAVFMNALTEHLTELFKTDKLPISVVYAVKGGDNASRKDDFVAAANEAEQDGEGAQGEDEGEDEDEDEDDASTPESVDELKRLLNLLPDDGNKDESEKLSADDLLKKSDELIGAADFKALIKELVSVAPLVRESGVDEVIRNRCFVFSIEDGHGLTTYLDLLAEAVALNYPEDKQRTSVYETDFAEIPTRAENASESVSSFRSKLGMLRYGGVICFDISKWMGQIGTELFRECLDAVSEHTKNNVFVFRIPYVDKDVLARVCYAINDKMGVKAISFAPFTQSELAQYARREFARMGFSLSEDAGQLFDEKMREEKADGRFYGMRTVTKVVRELVYNRLVADAGEGSTDRIVTADDVRRSLMRGGIFANGKTAQEELDAMIGCEGVKQRVREIVAQILTSKKGKTKYRPCIHMRFVGNPGTGKTTVARILGKLLKEKGVLRVGNFYEHGARDLCGRYVGETSPKTSGICRDAYGSVLFLDEAYSLAKTDSDKDFGKEAIETLIAEMENHRDDFVVIMAGYTDEMDKLMESNPGLKSRMPYTIEFPNYSRKELYEIFVKMATSMFECDKAMLAEAKKYFEGLDEDFISSKKFGNGRFVRNLFERTWAKAAMRWQISGEDRQILKKEDFDKAKAEKDFSTNERTPRIGFLR